MITAAPERRAGAALIGGGGLAFLLVALARVVYEGGSGLLALPVLVFVVEAAAAVALLSGLRPARLACLVLAVVIALLHLVIALGAGPWPTRLAAVVLTLAHVYAVVVLAAGTATTGTEDT